MNGTHDPIEEARHPGTGWVVAIAHGGRYLGRQGDERPILSPVYELSVDIVRGTPGDDGKPRFAVVYQCAPVLFLSGWTRMTLPADALVCPLEDLPLGERQRLMAAAQQGAALVEELKLAQSPIARPRIVAPR